MNLYTFFSDFERLGVQVKIWFQNRRMKWRNSKERELLSQGGTREQTLPTKVQIYFNSQPLTIYKRISLKQAC